jgi:hypothetical protein
MGSNPIPATNLPERIMDLSLLEKVVLNYLQKHPEVVEKLLERLLDRLAASLVPKDAVAGR